jgi:hypothetical protein
VYVLFFFCFCFFECVSGAAQYISTATRDSVAAFKVDTPPLSTTSSRHREPSQAIDFDATVSNYSSNSPEIFGPAGHSVMTVPNRLASSISSPNEK